MSNMMRERAAKTGHQDTQMRRRAAVSWASGFGRQIALPAIVVLSVLANSRAFALDVADTRWGFNGKVAVNRFNLLSVLVNNPTPQPFEGEMRLRKALGGAGFVDATIVEPISLAPFASKWVQFYPFIAGDGYRNSADNENWHLAWGRGESFDVPVPRVAKYQRVVLDDPSGLAAKGGVLKRMPENLFPAFVTATDALQAVALDHEPRTWVPGQKEALLDWLHLGGTIVILYGPTGKFPEFTGPLASFNSPLEDARHGAGRVLRVPMMRQQLDDDEVRQVFAGLPKNYLGPNEKAEDPIDFVDPSLQSQANTGLAYGEGSDPFHSSSFLGQLKQMTKPDHNWVLLHLMFWVYIGMVFPGCYILGKRYSDFRVVYAGLLGTVMLFSFLFSVVGQRGYGEATAVHCVAIARSLPDGALDVSQWSNVFVTSGADYDIKHNGRGLLYSTCNQNESVNGKINNGAEAIFKVDIPPFSNREFAHRIKLATGGPSLKIESLKLDEGRPTQLSLSVDGLKKADVESQYLLYGNRFFGLNWQGERLELAHDAGDATAILRLQNYQNWSNNSYGYAYGNAYDPYNQKQVQTAHDRFQLMFTPLLSRSLNVGREREAQQVQLPTDIVRVYLYAKMPGEFAVQNAKLGRQEGNVLYCIDVPLTAK